MDRRHFMRHAAVTTLGVIALPFASALHFLSGASAAQAVSFKETEELSHITEQEVVELTLSYAESWQNLLPGVDIRETLLQRLQRDKSSRSG